MQVGIIAIGSHEEDHGPALPPDTDARIAYHIGRKTAEKTSAEFLGTLNSSHEFLDIDTGNHQPLQEVLEELEQIIQKSKDLGFEALLLVNAHGGNQKLEDHIKRLQKKTKIKLKMDSTICQIEGPHAGTGEVSVGAVLGMVDETKVDEQSNVEKYPEVGFAGFDHIREKYEWAEEHAQEILNEGVKIDEELGEKLLDSAVTSAVEKIRNFERETEN